MCKMQCVGSADAVPVSRCPLHAQESCLCDCVDASFSSFSSIFSLADDRYCHQIDGWSLAFCRVLSDGYHDDGACGCHGNCHHESVTNVSCVLAMSAH